MKVSVIMCAYNTEEYIHDAIQSITAQTYADWELIISDDRSKDKTLEIAQSYAAVDDRIRVYLQPKNLGYIKNKNWAIAQATGSLITQLDSDDACPADRLEKQVNAFKNNPEIKICGTNFQYLDSQGKIQVVKEYKEDFLVTELVQDYPFWYPSLMFRKELLNEFGYFSEYFHGIYGDDYHWTLRVNQKYPVYFVHDILYFYRFNPDSLTNFYNGNNRKLIAVDILIELYRQHKETGTDMIESGNVASLLEFEEKLFNDRKLMAKRFREWAAKAIDKKSWDQAKLLLSRSYSMNKANPEYYKTYLYYLRAKAKHKQKA